jgi:hypothetical protein
MRQAALTLSALVLAGAALAEEPTAKGVFKSGSVEMPVTSAVAFRGKDLFSPEREALIVAISHAKFAAGVVEAYTDRKRAIDRRFKDDETVVVYLSFTPEGKWRGLSYDFGPGNGCGFCTSDVKSTVKLGGGRLAGAVSGKEKNRTFDVTLDVPVMSDDHGAALGEGGGDPGKAYLAYHAALVKGDEAALKALLPPDRLQQWDKAQKGGNLPKFLNYLREEHGLRSVKVSKGWAKADRAVLLIAGEGASGPVTGEATLLREKGTWRVDDELTDAKAD